MDAIRHLPGICFIARREVDVDDGGALSPMNIAWANPVADIVVAAEGITAIHTAAAVALPPQDLALIVSEDYFSRDVTGVLLETLHEYRATFPNYHPLVQGLGSLAEQGLLLEAEAKSQVMPLGVEEEVLPRHDRVVQDGVKPHSTPAMMYALRSWSSTTCA